MPYIERERKEIYQEILGQIEHEWIVTAADLSFLITQLMAQYLKRFDKIKWIYLTDVLSAVDAAREAFMEDVYRPHEAKKRKENGGVF